ncbi:MAG TPA: Hint domain-containing protein, partial [Acetobacteraceae bacterium]|nr:Hint domain-containing protein [Acetobacteraceae bacterium]
LKFDNTVTLARAITMSNANQTLEIGAGGAVTINVTQAVNPGTIKMDGGTLTDTGGISFGNGGGLTGSGKVAANLTGGSTDNITASGGTLDLTGTFGSGLVAAIDATKPSDLKFDNTGTLSAPIAITSSNQTLEVGSAGNLTINGAQSVSGGGTIKLDGGTLTDSNGLTVGSGGTLTGFGTAPNAITLAGGTISQSGGVLNALFITGFGTVNGVTGTTSPVTGASQIVAFGGGTLDLTGTVSGAQLVVDATKAGVANVLKVDGNVTAGGIGSIQINNANQTVEIGAASTLTLTQLESMTNGTIKLDGGTLTDAAGVSVGKGAKLLGKGVVVGPISGGGTIEATGGLLNIGGNLTNGMVLQADSVASSVLELGGTISTSTSFTYLNTGGVFNGTLQLDAGALVSFGTNGVISGMNVAIGSGTTPTDVLDLRSVAFSSSYSTDIVGGNTIQLWGDVGHTSLLASFHLAAPVATGTFVDWQADSGGGTNLFLDDDPCYVAGTHILTATGERMVESLMQGDIVLTLAGGDLSARPVKWIGRRRIDLTAHPRPETAAPIRIRRGAFADNMPHRDLLVSPDHAVFVDGKLICARQLANGATIRQEKGRAAVEYFHVELDAHAILLAEGLPAESYLNTGNHGFFINSGEPLVLHPDMTDETDYPTREAASCAPFVSDEASVLPVWQRLAARAAALGLPVPKLEITSDPELQIIAKGRTVRPLYGENGLYIFVLPKGATEARLISRAGSPADVRPWLDDRRCLGVNVERIVLRGASELREVPVDHPGLSRGWHVVERDGIALRRWTSGDAVLPLPALGGPTMLEIRAGNGGMGYVVGADAKAEVERMVA